jgi:1-acyl-sn-glycerol-3-phosphate acyltransferase
MGKIRKYREPGRGPVFWWLDRAIIILVALIFIIYSRIFCRLQASGQKNVPKSGMTLYLANHPSTIGIFSSMVAVFWPWVIMPKMLAFIPVVVGKGKYVKALGPLQSIFYHFNVIPLWDREVVGKRSDIVAAVIQVLTQVAKGCVWLFAEGTRTEPGQLGLLPFNAGVGKIVAKTLPQIVFVWDQGSHLACPKGQWPGWQAARWYGLPIFRRTPVKVSIARAINAADETTTLYGICQTALEAGDCQPVADYLRNLCWAFAVASNPEAKLAEIEAINPSVLADLERIIG